MAALRPNAVPISAGWFPHKRTWHQQDWYDYFVGQCRHSAIRQKRLL